MNYVLAVSGGVDSMVLLDMYARNTQQVWGDRVPGRIIVAHYDHGIREDSHLDSELVARTSADHGLEFYSDRGNLGSGASEEVARVKRYGFLRSVASAHQAMIITAHHGDDVVETVAINLTRGTGWRGLAVLDSPDVMRPLLGWTKQQILAYAVENSLSWNEDSTNVSPAYLRNRIRAKTSEIPEQDRFLVRAYRDRQVFLKSEIDDTFHTVIGNPPYSRHIFIQIDATVAIELLRTIFTRHGVISPTIPQRERALHAIKVAKTGKTHSVSKGVQLSFTSTTFIVVTTV